MDKILKIKYIDKLKSVYYGNKRLKNRKQRIE